MLALNVVLIVVVTHMAEYRSLIDIITAIVIIIVAAAAFIATVRSSFVIRLAYDSMRDSIVAGLPLMPMCS